MKCFYCHNVATITKFIGVPGYIMVPNMYGLCDSHKEKEIKFEDIYNPDGSRKS